ASRVRMSRTIGVSPMTGYLRSSGVAGIRRNPTWEKPAAAAHDTISGGASSSTVSAASDRGLDRCGMTLRLLGGEWRAERVLHGGVREHDRGADRDPGSGVRASHYRLHVVADRVEARDGPMVAIEHLRVLVGHEAAGCADVTGIKLYRVERC